MALVRVSRKEIRQSPLRSRADITMELDGQLYLINPTSSTTSIFYYSSTPFFRIIFDMFSATRLHIFVCLALGIAVSAAPAGSGSNLDARSPDVYDLTGGIGALLFGYPEGYGGDSDEDAYILRRQIENLKVGSRLDINMGAALGEGLGLGNAVPLNSIPKRDLYDLTGGIGALLFGYPEGEAGESDEDAYILKRQLAGSSDIGSHLASNMGIQHAVPLAEAGLGLAGAVNAVSKRDLYDTTGGIGALLFGAEGYGGEAGEDEYILKRDVSEVEARAPDFYDLTGGIGALIFGAEGEGYGGGGGEDDYILKRP
ncbi:unnamed protein product [Peniophora sp. CBMAI 1063]|nr:unnamed protein product [Peniophora sp. CBMAI 1063]